MRSLCVIIFTGLDLKKKINYKTKTVNIFQIFEKNDERRNMSVE